MSRSPNNTDPGSKRVEPTIGSTIPLRSRVITRRRWCNRLNRTSTNRVTRSAPFIEAKHHCPLRDSYVDRVFHPLLEALRPVADAIDATLVSKSGLQEGDIELQWEGCVVGGLRLPEPGGLSAHVAAVEREVGQPLAGLDREGKQRAVKLLSERGAFRLRKSVEEVAGLLGVSRFTVYNYLNRPAD
jgi:hypothetical protein